jgi:hypothetical protein
MKLDNIFGIQKLDLDAAFDAITAMSQAVDMRGLDNCDCPVCKSMKSSNQKLFPGRDHHQPAIGRAEKLVFDLIDFRKLYDNIIQFLGLSQRLQKAIKKDITYDPAGMLTPEDMNTINTFIVDELAVPLESIEAAAVKSYIIGNIISSAEARQKAVRASIDSLPKTLTDAVKLYQLNDVDIRQINIAKLRICEAITRISDRSRHEVAKYVIQSQAERWENRQLQDKLFQEIIDTNSNLNRDWQSVAITEGNTLANNGYLASQEPGTVVVGWSHPDACGWCKANINGKEFIVREKNPGNYGHLDPKSEKYQELAKIWETDVWVGKNNVGRSISNRKRGEDGLEERMHHERAMPCIPAHPYGRCRYIRKI